MEERNLTVAEASWLEWEGMGPVREPECWFAQPLRCGLQEACSDDILVSSTCITCDAHLFRSSRLGFPLFGTERLVWIISQYQRKTGLFLVERIIALPPEDIHIWLSELLIKCYTARQGGIKVEGGMKAVNKLNLNLGESPWFPTSSITLSLLLFPTPN